MKLAKLFLPVAILVALPIAYLLTLGQQPFDFPSKVAFEGPKGKVTVIRVVVADSPVKQARGLMGVESLPRDAGMLFPFASEANRSFWMANTKLPLDIIFIGAGRRVSSVLTAQPCRVSDLSACELYSGNAKWVLEVNAGFAKTHGIKEGSTATV